MGVSLMDCDQSSMSQENVIQFTAKRNQSFTLKELLKKEPELRGFFRFVKRHDLRTQALALIDKKISGLN